MKPEILGWARHLVSVTTSDVERAMHAVVKKAGWQHVALCGASCPNGFADMNRAPPVRGSHYERCDTCAGLASVASWDLELRDDLFGLRHPEDGSEFTASVFYVVATAPDGRRYAHEHRFPAAHVVVEDDYMGIASYRSEALAKAERFFETVLAAQRAGAWNEPNAHWHEIDPVYGSVAYVQDEPFIVARERVENRV